MLIHTTILGFVISVVLSYSAFSQGRLFGRVIDEGGKPVAAATVYINNGATNRAALTNAQGYYVFLGISQGSYAVKVFKTGYPKLNRENVAVASNSTSRHDFKFGDNSSPAIAAATRVKKPVTPKAETAAKEVEIKAEAKKEEEVIVVKNEAGEAEELDAKEAEEIKKAEEIAKEEEAALTVAAEKEVALEGGIAAIQKAVVYPPTAVNLKIEGKVVIRVFVGKDGAPLRSEIVKSAHELLDEEALRVISENAKFTPAVVNGQNAVGVITVPITFKLGKVVW